MRVLILADICNPEWPSLPTFGYKAAHAIAEHADVEIITQVRNRPAIEKVGIGRAEVRYVDSEYLARPMHRLATTLRRGSEGAWMTARALAYPGYLAFEREAWKATRDELHAGAFDLVHRLTPVSPALPSPMARWSPVPFVLGPLNGGLKWPPAFRRELAREREWLAFVRGAYRLLPYQASTYRKAAAILAAFRHTIEDLPRHTQDRVTEISELGIDPELFRYDPQRVAHGQKTILFAGRLVPYKLPQVLVQAFADYPGLHAHRLVIVGEGPERPAIERLVHARGLAGRVALLGWKSQAEVAALMREADIFAFPSVREVGGGVVVEAMASGLACVVVDYGGPGGLIAPDRGVKVPLGTRDELVRSFGEALEGLIADPATTVRLGAAAREFALRHYTWDAKARTILSVYDWVLGRGPKPVFAPARGSGVQPEFCDTDPAKAPAARPTDDFVAVLPGTRVTGLAP